MPQILDQVQKRVEWEQYQARQKRKAEEEQEKQRSEGNLLNLQISHASAVYVHVQCTVVVSGIECVPF